MKYLTRWLIRHLARLLSRLDPELTEAEYRIAGLPWDELRHGGIGNECVSGSEDGEHDVFRCSACNRWTCDCLGSGDTDVCSDCWAMANVFGRATQ